MRSTSSGSGFTRLGSSLLVSADSSAGPAPSKMASGQYPPLPVSTSHRGGMPGSIPGFLLVNCGHPYDAYSPPSHGSCNNLSLHLPSVGESSEITALYTPTEKLSDNT